MRHINVLKWGTPLGWKYPSLFHTWCSFLLTRWENTQKNKRFHGSIIPPQIKNENSQSGGPQDTKWSMSSHWQICPKRFPLESQTDYSTEESENAQLYQLLTYAVHNCKFFFWNLKSQNRNHWRSHRVVDLTALLFPAGNDPSLRKLCAFDCFTMHCVSTKCGTKIPVTVIKSDSLSQLVIRICKISPCK